MIVGAFALGIAIQVPVTALSDEQVSTYSWTWNILTNFLQRVVDGAVLGVELGGSFWGDWGWPFLIAITAAVTILLIALMLRAPSGRLFAAIAVATSVVMFLGSSYSRAVGDAMAWGAGVHNELGGRYAVVPALLLLSAVLALIDSNLRSSRSRPFTAAVTAATVAVMLVAIVTSFDTQGDAIDRGGPPWRESIDVAAAQCEAQGLTEAQVPTTPEGWAVIISCDRLVDGR